MADWEKLNEAIDKGYALPNITPATHALARTTETSNEYRCCAIGAALVADGVLPDQIAQGLMDLTSEMFVRFGMTRPEVNGFTYGFDYRSPISQSDSGWAAGQSAGAEAREKYIKVKK